MTVSEAMNIPGAPLVMQTSAMRPIPAGNMAATARRVPTGTTPRMGGWSGPAWPAVGASVGRYTPLGASPFGRSVDMGEVVAQLMEGAAPCASTSVGLALQPADLGIMSFMLQYDHAGWMQ